MGTDYTRKYLDLPFRLIPGDHIDIDCLSLKDQDKIPEFISWKLKQIEWEVKETSIVYDEDDGFYYLDCDVRRK